MLTGNSVAVSHPGNYTILLMYDYLFLWLLEIEAADDTKDWLLKVPIKWKNLKKFLYLVHNYLKYSVCISTINTINMIKMV